MGGKKKVKRKLYTEEDLQHCLHAIRNNNKLGVKGGAEQFGIPETTVRDRYHGRSKCRINSGPKRCLLDDEENRLATYVRCIYFSMMVA